MRVLFLIQGMQTPSSRFRVLQYIPFLQQKGVYCDVCVTPKNPIERLWLFLNMHQYDICFIQKKIFSVVELAFIKRYARRIIYDFDDAVMFRSTYNEKKNYSYIRQQSFARTARHAFHVIAGNDYLQSLALQYNQQVSVIPTVIDTTLYTPQERQLHQRIRIGWIGSESSNHFINLILPALIILKERVAFDFYIISSNTKHIDPNYIEQIAWYFIPWDEKNEIQYIQSFDIGVMPLDDTVWTRGKCGFKLLQYMACGIPTVASPVGVNTHIIQQGYNGFLAQDTAQWIQRLEQLAIDRVYAKRVGLQSRHTIEERYSLAHWSEQLYRIICQSPPPAA